MKGPAWVWPARAERWRKPAIVAVSVLLHGGVFAFLGLRAIQFDLPPVDDPLPVIYVQIEPRPLLPGEIARVRATPETPDSPAPAPPGAPTANRDLPFRDPSEDDDQPAPPSPRIGAPVPGAPAPPADVGAWTVRPETMGDRVGRGLRGSTVGCASPDLLTRAERAICDDRFGERAAAAAPIEGTGNPGRDARFAREGARRLAEYEARRRPLSGGAGVIGPGDCPGSNFGTGCAGANLAPELRQGATTTHNPAQARPGVGPLRNDD
jgi:hypothetical protein